MSKRATLWREAAGFAARMHAGQFRKDKQTPYIAHPFRVAMTVRDVFGIDDLVGGIAQDVPSAVGLLPGPVARQPVGLVLAQPPVGLHQAARHAIEAVVALEGQFAAVEGLDAGDPLGIARRCLRGPKSWWRGASPPGAGP